MEEKVVHSGELLYTDYFTLFAKGQLGFLLKSSPQRTEAEGVVRLPPRTVGLGWGCAPRLLLLKKNLNEKESKQNKTKQTPPHLKLPLGKLFCL